MKLTRGIYLTDYGNAAYVSGPRAKLARDIDAGERIPIECVTDKRIRRVEKGDEPNDCML